MATPRGRAAPASGRSIDSAASSERSPLPGQHAVLPQHVGPVRQQFPRPNPPGRRQRLLDRELDRLRPRHHPAPAEQFFQVERHRHRRPGRRGRGTCSAELQERVAVDDVVLPRVGHAEHLLLVDRQRAAEHEHRRADRALAERHLQAARSSRRWIWRCLGVTSSTSAAATCARRPGGRPCSTRRTRATTCCGTRSGSRGRRRGAQPVDRVELELSLQRLQSRVQREERWVDHHEAFGLALAGDGGMNDAELALLPQQLPPSGRPPGGRRGRARRVGSRRSWPYVGSPAMIAERPRPWEESRRPASARLVVRARPAGGGAGRTVKAV